MIYAMQCHQCGLWCDLIQSSACDPCGIICKDCTPGHYAREGHQRGELLIPLAEDISGLSEN